MAVVGAATVLVRPSFTGLQKSTAAATAGIDRQMGQAAPGIGKRMSSGIGRALKAGAVAGAAAAGIAAAAALTAGFRSAITQQDTSKTLQGLYGSASAATDMMARLKDVSRESPIDYAAYAKGSQSLAYMGIQGEQAEQILRNVGAAVTASGGGSEEMGRATDAMLKMVNAGKVQLDTLNQLSESGTPIFSALASHFNTNIANVREMVTSGKVGIDDVMSAVENAEGKTFKQMKAASEQVSKSFSNQWKIAKDAIVVALGENLIPLLERAAPMIGAAGTAIADFIGKASDAMSGLSDLITKGDYTGKLKKAFGWEEDSPVVKMILGVRDALNGVKTAGDGTAGVLGGLVGAAKAVAGSIQSVVDAVWPILKQIGERIMTVIGENLPQIQAVAEQVGTIITQVMTLMSMYFGRMAKNITAVWSVIGPYVLDFLGSIIKSVISVLGGVLKIISGVLDVLIGIFTGDFSMIKSGVVKIFKGMWTILYTVASSAGKLIQKWLGDWITRQVGRFIGFASRIIAAIRGAWVGVKNFFGRIRGVFAALASWVATKFMKAWGKVQTWIVRPIQLGVRRVRRTINQIQYQFLQIKLWVQKTWTKGWNKIKNWIGDPVDAGRKAVGRAQDKIQSGLNRMKNWGKKTWAKAWSGMKQVVSDPIGSARKVIDSQQGRIRNVLNKLDGWGKKIFGKRWAGMKNTFTAPIKAVIRYFRNVFGPGGGGIRKIFGDAVNAVGRIWGKIKSKMFWPVHWIVSNVINKGIIRGINTIARFVKADPIKKVAMPALATGGPARGPGTGTSDSFLARLSNNEHVWTAREVLSAGGHAAVERLRSSALHGKLRERREGLPGYAQGGRVVQPVNGSVTNRHSRLQYPWASFAGDFAMPTGSAVRSWKDGIVALVKHLTTSYGRHMRVNHSDGTSSLYAHLSRILASVGDHVTAGQKIGEVGSTGNSTGPHLHFETRGGLFTAAQRMAGNAGSALGMVLPDVQDLISGAASRAMKGFKKFAGSPYGQILSKLPPKLASMAVDWGQDRLSAFSPFGAAGQNYGADRMGIAKTIVSTADRLGFGNRGAIIGLITGMVESGLRNVNFGDRDSLGVFQQRAPWGPRSARTNPAQAAQMFYMGGQGGQPGLRDKPWRSMGMGEAAQAVQVSAFPGRYSQEIGEAKRILARIRKAKSFDTGGWLPEGLSLISNNTGQPERVRSPDQERELINALADSRQPIQITIEGDVLDGDQTVRKIIRGIEQYDRRRGRVQVRARSR